jgi:diaminopimelate epimerase
MTRIHFSKYEGTGNDFILIDNLNGTYNFLSEVHVMKLCDRKLGIGADGLILINSDVSSDFYMDFFNSDGSKSFCGNGSRCAVQYTLSLGIHKGKTKFRAIDGFHKGTVTVDNISIEMNDVSTITAQMNDFVLDTGSPHYVLFNDDLSSENTIRKGKEIRYSPSFLQNGINVNLLQVLAPDQIKIATYERGVEDETQSCGTGATACALVHDFVTNSSFGKIQVQVKGGDLTVSFKRGSKGNYSQIVLSGPAKFVFSGTIDC